MKWLESIYVQVNTGQHRDVRHHLKDLARQIMTSGQYPDLYSAEVFGHASLKGDHILTLTWYRQNMSWPGSALGLQIKEIMQHYGLTDHTIWYAVPL